MRFRHRIIAAWLLLALSLPSPAVALRQVEPLERRAGLEEALRHQEFEGFVVTESTGSSGSALIPNWDVPISGRVEPSLNGLPLKPLSGGLEVLEDPVSNEVLSAFFPRLSRDARVGQHSRRQHDPTWFGVLYHELSRTWWLKLPVAGTARTDLGPVRAIGISLMSSGSPKKGWTKIHPALRWSRNREYLLLPLPPPYQGVTVAIDRQLNVSRLEHVTSIGLPAAGLEEGLRGWDRASADRWQVLSGRVGRALLVALVQERPDSHIAVLDRAYWTQPRRGVSTTSVRQAYHRINFDPGQHLVLVAPEGQVGLLHRNDVPVGDYAWTQEHLYTRAATELTDDLRRLVGLPAAGLEEGPAVEASGYFRALVDYYGNLRDPPSSTVMAELERQLTASRRRLVAALVARGARADADVAQALERLRERHLPGGRLTEEELQRVHETLGELRSAAAGPEWGRRAGLEELEGVVQAWADVSATPARETPKRLFPIFYAPETFRAIPLVAKGGLPFVAIVGSDLEEARVRALLDGLGIHPENYWIRQAGPTGDRAALLPTIREEFTGQYNVVPVEPSAEWLRALLAGLEEIGVLPLGDLDRALQATERYFARLA